MGISPINDHSFLNFSWYGGGKARHQENGLWQPKSGDQVVVLKGGPGGEEVFVLGTHKEQRAAALEDGEVYLFSERASICLRNNGAIELTGQLLINGEAYAPCDCGTSGPGGL